jgi:hypothetical protein
MWWWNLYIYSLFMFCGGVGLYAVKEAFALDA